MSRGKNARLRGINPCNLRRVRFISKSEATSPGFVHHQYIARLIFRNAADDIDGLGEISAACLLATVEEAFAGGIYAEDFTVGDGCAGTRAADQDVGTCPGLHVEL